MDSNAYDTITEKKKQNMSTFFFENWLNNMSTSTTYQTHPAYDQITVAA